MDTAGLVYNNNSYHITYYQVFMSYNVTLVTYLHFVPLSLDFDIRKLSMHIRKIARQNVSVQPFVSVWYLVCKLAN